MATLNKTLSGIFTDSKGMKPTRVVFRISWYKKTKTLELSTFDGITIAVPLEQVQKELLKALGEVQNG